MTFPKPAVNGSPPTLHLLIGLPGSGKTTLARQLERELPALRLTPDEWMVPLVGDGEGGGKRDYLEQVLLWGVAVRALELGLNVVLDFGFWSAQEREMYRQWAEKLGATVELHFLDVPLDELWRRIESRNADLPAGTFAISRAELEEWHGWFQRPTAEELTVSSLL